jgi:hypothetical protein
MRKTRNPLPWVQVIDARTEYMLRMAYLNGWISIDVYLDRKFGTAFASAGGHRRAG